MTSGSILSACRRAQVVNPAKSASGQNSGSVLQSNVRSIVTLKFSAPFPGSSRTQAILPAAKNEKLFWKLLFGYSVWRSERRMQPNVQPTRFLRRSPSDAGSRSYTSVEESCGSPKLDITGCIIIRIAGASRSSRRREKLLLTTAVSEIPAIALTMRFCIGCSQKGTLSDRTGGVQLMEDRKQSS